MTKLLKVNCGVCFDGYLPEADEDYNPWIMEVERYYTSEDIAEAFEFAEKRKLEFTFSKDYCFDFQKEWVEVDETEIPEQMVNTGVLHEIYCSRWYDAFNTKYIHNDWYDDRYIDGWDWYIDDWDEF